MTGFIVVGTDTDAGKTAFSLLFLTAFADRFDYWKPVETGDPDSLKVRTLVPEVTVLEPLARFREPVAPALAARREGRVMPEVADILASVPVSPRSLLIETFGGPLSPLTDDVLQIDLIRALGLPVVLVGSSAIGAIGRALQAHRTIAAHGIPSLGIVLMGPRDEYAIEQIEKHTGGRPVVGLQMPNGNWTPTTLKVAATEQRSELERIVATPKVERDLIHRDREVVWHPYTALADPCDPLPVVAAEREFLHLADGRTLIDAISSWWTILHGHRYPPLVTVLVEAAGRLDHVLFAGVTHPPAVELAELLLASCPWTGGRVFFSDNGSTAVEVALKMAYQFWCHRGEPERTLFVGFEGGYHGDTFGAMAVGRDPLFFGRFEPLLFRALRVPVSAAALDDALSKHRGRVAAVILEPLVQGAGGMLMHSPAELRDLFEMTKRHGVLFIADEVMTAYRTGTVWAHTQARIAPDLICTAKTIAGGMLPLAATLVSPNVVAEFDTADRSRTFFHGHSFTANPLACAVGVANWNLLKSDSWQAESARIESFWRERLAPLRERRNVRICGTIAAIELADEGGYLAPIGPRIRELAIQRGVLLRPLGNVVYAMPPLCTSNESLAKIVDVMVTATD